ncbi:MAG: lipid II flippase MurJ [Bacteroidota bacterium]
MSQLKSKITKLWKKYGNQLLSNILTVGLVSIAVKCIGLFKEILIADTYGVSQLLDTYLIAVLVPTFIQSVFLEAYGSVFIPNYVQAKKEATDTRGFVSSNLLIVLGISLILMIITYWGIDIYLEILFPGHEVIYYELIKTQLFLILPSIPFWGISALLSGLLMVNDDFLYSSMHTALIPIVTIILLLFGQSFFQEKTLALGMLIGSILGSTYLIFLAHYKKVINMYVPDFKSDAIRVLFRQIPAKISSGLINGLNPMIDQYFSAQLTIGAISSLSYGYKIPMVAISLVTAPLGSALLPYFSKKAADDQNGQLFLDLKNIIGKGFLFMGCFALVLIVFSRFMVSMLFERGAFSSDDTLQVYLIQQMYLLQLPFYVAGLVMNKYLTAINRNNFLVLSSLVSLVLNIILNAIFIKIMGAKGLALATAMVSLCNGLVIYSYILKLNKKHTYV